MTPAEPAPAVTRAAAARAAKRRLRVVLLILAANAAVAGLAYAGDPALDRSGRARAACSSPGWWPAG